MLWIWINPVGLGRRKIGCWPGRDAIRQFDNWTWGVIGCYSAIDNLLLIEFIYQGSSVCLVVLGCARPQPDIDMPCNAIEGSRCISFSSSFSGSSDCDEECGINSRGDFEILRWVFESAPPYSVLLSFWLMDFWLRDFKRLLVLFRHHVQEHFFCTEAFLWTGGCPAAEN